ncbi:DNA sulfur modification protein DndD [Flintibacter sp. HCN-6482]|uniref:DNA sulfur modification protein DndD n=1 Tax=Flintibacter sp. HCN-6482 TaxID=3134672 RepID=UPI0030C381EC
MYFTKIELHNFGIYKGHHEMCLSDQIGNRNVTLIGGLNGRGKTTFLDAILLALYGKQALKYIQENARSYERLLIEHINKHATDELTYVAVSLCLDDGTALRVCRNWKLKGKKVDESISVEKNGTIDKYLGESWSYYIEEILPFGIARFFFFDNEKITQLADDASFEQIKTSIKSAIGVSTIEKAITHIDEVIRRKKDALQAFEKSEVNQGYQEVEAQLKELNAKIEAARREAEVLKANCESIAIAIDTKEKKFWASGGDLTLSRDAIKQEKEKIKAYVQEVRDEIMLRVSDPATPLFMCRKLVTQAYDEEIDEQKKAALKLSDPIVESIQKNILDRFNQSDFDDRTLRIITDIVKQEIRKFTSVGEDMEHINMSHTTMLLFDKLIVEIFHSLDQKIKTLISHVDAQENELMSLDAHLGESDEKTMAMKLYETLKEYERKKALADDQYKKQQSLIENLEHQKEILHSKRLQLIKAIAEKENTNDDNSRIIKYSVMSIEVLNEFKVRLQREKIDKLSATATECFQTLVEKDSLVSKIHIDTDSLDVTILDPDGHVVLKNQLSAGEQQMFAISIVWALARTSGYKAPVVIDTPMARLDSSHRANFVNNYLPSASSQVMVLSTDEEIYGRYLDMIRENVVNYFTLHYREDEQCTSIINGYFEGM